GRSLARLAGVRPAPVRWRQVGDGPWFDNQVATLRIDGRRIELAIDKALPDTQDGGWDGRAEPRLERVFSHRLA
ncbi:MAG: alkaline phosphatase D family protein, partial [Solirubrobacteraceae bacterium]